MSTNDRSPSPSKAETLRDLAAALRQVRERVHSPQSTVQSKAPSTLNAQRGATQHWTLNTQHSALLSTGLPPLDALLPAGGLRRGTFIEWLADGPGTGVERLALSIVPHALRPGGVCLLIDPRQEFFPRGAAAMGIDLDRLIVLRPGSLDDALWSAEQALRCPGVDVVFGWDELVPRGRAPDRVFRRLQLAAEEGGTLGVLLRPAAVQRQRCWGDLRVLASPVELRVERGELRDRRSHNPCNSQLPTPGSLPSTLNHQPSTLSPLSTQLTLLHCRGRLAGMTFILEINHETGAVHLVSELAGAASAGGAARA